MGKQWKQWLTLFFWAPKLLQMVIAVKLKDRKWQPTPVFLPGESHGGRSLVGYNPRQRRVGHDWAISLSLSLLGRKVMTNLDSILKSRDITLPTNVRLVKAMVFPVVMYGCESRTIKKAERRRIDAFELCCWRLLRVPWTTRRSN